MKAPIHTSDSRHFIKLWFFVGGWVKPIKGTGELNYGHVTLQHPLRINVRR